MIKIEVEISNPADKEEMQAVTDFFARLGGVGPTVTVSGNAPMAVSTSAAPAQEEKPKKPAAKKPRAKVAPKVEEKPEASAPAQEEAPAEEKTDTGGVTMEQLRAKVTAKGKAHKVAIKGKLTELGANNVGTLPKEHYQALSDFLDGLE